MELSSVKRFLQNYLDNIVSPRVNERREKEGLEPINFSVQDVLKGSFQPVIIHIFLDTEPLIRKTFGIKTHTRLLISEIERDITDFLKMLSIDYKVKIHWNKRPIFNNETLSADH